MTRPYAEVIGDPIAQSKSPLIHNFWLAKLGIDAEYRACHVRPEELADYFTRRRGDAEWRGCNVTIPHKVDALRFADEVELSTKFVGATNCIISSAERLVAYNTDTLGLDVAIPSEDAPVCMIGAGGAARAVVSVLDFTGGAWFLRVVARDPVRAAKLLDPENDYGIKFYGIESAAKAMLDAQGVINASPLGMAGQPPMPNELLNGLSLTKPDAWVFDMVYAPLETELLKAARVQGRETVDGLVMLIEQAAAAFEKFFGQPPPREFDSELRALLTK
jgi:shikimate dehydrogenase